MYLRVGCRASRTSKEDGERRRRAHEHQSKRFRSLKSKGTRLGFKPSVTQAVGRPQALHSSSSSSARRLRRAGWRIRRSLKSLARRVGPNRRLHAARARRACQLQHPRSGGCGKWKHTRQNQEPADVFRVSVQFES